MSGPVLLDTSVIVAALDPNQQRHRACLQITDGLDRALVTCEAVITEACYLLRQQPRAVESVLSNVARGVFQIPWRLAESAVAVSGLMRKYGDVPADFADACLIHLAEQLHQGDILTLDSDFRVYRWGRNRPFRLLLETADGG